MLRLDHVHQQPRQIQRIGRCSDLVVNHADCVMGFTRADHRLDEVLAVQSEYPRDTHDEVLFEDRGNSQFAVKFALSVNIERRIALVVRLPGASLRFGSMIIDVLVWIYLVMDCAIHAYAYVENRVLYE